MGRKASLSVVIGYNQSDTAIGWFHFLAGLTLYYSDPEEATLDPLYSVSMPPGTVPMLSIVQLRTIKLGEYENTQGTIWERKICLIPAKKLQEFIYLAFSAGIFRKESELIFSAETESSLNSDFVP